MNRLTFKKRVWIVKQFKKGVSAVKIAMAQGVHRSAVYQILEKFEHFGWDGLKDHKTGRSELFLNPKVGIIILDVRKRFGYGACHIEQILKKRGFWISHRQIEKVLIRNNCIVLNPKKQKPGKWVRYELPHPNDVWHTDWTHCPFTDKLFSIYRRQNMSHNSIRWV